MNTEISMMCREASVSFWMLFTTSTGCIRRWDIARPLILRKAHNEELSFFDQGRCPETPRFIAVAPESLCYVGAAFTAPAIPASESTLGSHLCVALPFAQMLSEWTISTQPCNDFSLDGNYPINLLSHCRGSFHFQTAAPLPPILRAFGQKKSTFQTFALDDSGHFGQNRDASVASLRSDT
jgi:hypothetical protein